MGGFPYRIGFGFDVHRLVSGTSLRLGGIDIPSQHTALGHSDADVVLHALCDALLGALALGDIGQHFPDTDPSLKGIDSTLLLQRVMELVKQKGYAVGNADMMLCLERPKVKPFVGAMRRRIAALLEVGEDCVSVKATTNEKLGYVGEGKGLNAQAVVLIYRQ